MKKDSGYKEHQAKLSSVSDSVSAKPKKKHKKHLKCINDCERCCLDYSVYRVEVYFTFYELKVQKIQTLTLKPQKSENEFVFWELHKNTTCTPHPADYHRQEIQQQTFKYKGEWELLARESDFANNFEKFFTKNIYSRDKYNSIQYHLNNEFIPDFHKMNTVNMN